MSGVSGISGGMNRMRMNCGMSDMKVKGNSSMIKPNQNVESSVKMQTNQKNDNTNNKGKYLDILV